jgi:hypothetical protein
MSVDLEIADGSPWWLSPNVWTVPGNDPAGSPGLPVVGEPCYLWAHVLNTGSDGVQDATVRFYWADPSVGFDRNTANHVGDASVSLSASDAQDVLCLVSWHPSFVNGGHECVLAEAFHPELDPLPPGPAFNVPTDRHVAQHNLSVLLVAPHMNLVSMPFSIHNTSRVEREFAIRAEAGALGDLKPIANRLGHVLPRRSGKLTNAGFVTAAHACEPFEDVRAVVDRLVVGPGQRAGLSLVGELEGAAALVHVIQEMGGVAVGGLSVLALRGNARSRGGRK